MRIEPEKRRRRRLAVAIHHEHAIALNRHIVGQVGRHGRFANAALEVLDGDYGRLIHRRAGRGGAQHFTHIQKLFNGIAGSAAGIGCRRLGQPAIIFGHPNAVCRASEQSGGFGDAVSHIQTLARIGEKGFPAEAFDHSNAGVCQLGDSARV